MACLAGSVHALVLTKIFRNSPVSTNNYKVYHVYLAEDIKDRSKSGSNDIEVLASVDPGSTLALSIGPCYQKRLDYVQIINQHVKKYHKTNRKQADRKVSHLNIQVYHKL